MCIKIIGGRVVWPQNGVKLADSVIQREAMLGLDEACHVIISDQVSVRTKVLAYLSIFPLLIGKVGDEDVPEGPTLTCESVGINLTHRGHTLCLKSNKQLAICLDRDKEGTVAFVLYNPDKIVLKVQGVYLQIEMPAPPDCANCDCE
jgi:3-methyladenine DNA glycosylase Mpg